MVYMLVGVNMLLCFLMCILVVLSFRHGVKIGMSVNGDSKRLPAFTPNERKEEQVIQEEQEEKAKKFLEEQQRQINDILEATNVSALYTLSKEKSKEE